MTAANSANGSANSVWLKRISSSKWRTVRYTILIYFSGRGAEKKANDVWNKTLRSKLGRQFYAFFFVFSVPLWSILYSPAFCERVFDAELVADAGNYEID